MSGGDGQESEAAFLRAAARRAVERSSIRAVAVEVGISSGGLHKLLSGRTRRIYGTTITKLRTWYLREWATGGDGLTPAVAVFLVEQVLAPMQPGERIEGAQEFVRALERIYDSHGTPRPVWLSAVRDEYRMGGS